MSNYIQPDTVMAVGQFVAGVLNKDWCRDRAEILDYINKFREDLHLMYPEFKLFTNKFYCLKVECFPEDCFHTCECNGARYHGVTLPPDIDGVISVWDDETPMRTYSKWWEGRFGRITNATPQVQHVALQVHQEFATERALTRPSVLSFYAASDDDDGKVVTLKVTTSFGAKREIKVCLRGDGVVKTKETIRSVNSVVLPPDLKGTITVTQDNGLEIAEYCPYETVPTFRRLKLTMGCKAKQVLVHGNQKFRPVWFDTDIVEVGSRRIIETAMRMYRFGENTVEADQLRKAEIEEARLKKLLYGALDRQRGKMEQDNGNFTRVNLIKSACLPGYGARRFCCRTR